MNEYQINRGYPCDSQEWFFKMLGAPEFKHVWAPKKRVHMSAYTFPYMATDRGLRKVAAANNCGLQKTNEGWLVYDSEYGSLVAEQLTSQEVLGLFV